MPPDQAEAMRAAILVGAGLQKLWEVLGSTEVANAKATVEEDRVRIVELVEQSVGCKALEMRA